MSSFFVRRPIVAMVLSIVMVLIGAVALQQLPVAQYPEIVPPEILVSTSYQGASSVNIEQAVATPIEQQVNGVENMIYVRSINAGDGTMQLRVAFDVGTDLDLANVLTQNRVSQANATLPEEVKRYGVTVKKSLAFPLLLVALESPKGTYDSEFLSNYATINVVDAISRIRGVGQVNLFGGSDYAMRVWVEPDRLAQLGLTVTDLTGAIQRQNVLVPGGQLGGAPAPPGQETTYTLRTRDRLETPEEFGAIVVRTNPDGSQVRLHDVARVELGSLLYTSRGRLGGKPASVLAVYQQPGSNAVATAEAIRHEMDTLADRFPNDLRYSVPLDTTLPIEAGIEEIVHTLFEAIALVILVVFVFLQSFRATFIPLLTVPVALIGTFALFPLLGFSINVLSLLGLVLAIGIVVDDAIVVVEAVTHHIEHGLSPKEATLKAMAEVSGPVVAIALVLTAVFVPVAFMGGITGRLYQQFAITISVSVVLSAINALTLSPALAALLLRPARPSTGPLGRFFRQFNRGFDAFTARYLRGARFFAVSPLRTVAFLVGITVLAGFLATRVPGGFLPEEDQGYVLVNVQLPDAASLDRTDEIMRQVEGILGSTEEIQSYTTVTGYSLLTQAYSSGSGFVFVQLHPWGERPGSAHGANAVITKLNSALLARVPGAVAFAFGPPAIPGLGNGGGFSLMLQDRGGNDPAYLEEKTREFIASATTRPEIARVTTLYAASEPQIFADVDRDRALKLGLDLGELNATLSTFLGGAYVNDFNRFGRIYKVFVQAEAEYRSAEDDLGRFYARTREGSMVPLTAVVDLRQTTGPRYTNRFNLFRAAEVVGGPAPGYSSTQALAALEEVAETTLPADMTYAWNALSFQEKAAAGGAAAVFGLALLLVFLVLAAQYESWSLPFSVLLGTPFAVLGVFAGLAAMRAFAPAAVGESYVNNVFAQIGLVMLIGLAAKNAILIVEFATAEVRRGQPALEAAMTAARLRFRPILMTAFAFILGVLPLVRAAGAGAEARKVMGMATFAGMTIATVLGVLVVPGLFVLIQRIAPTKVDPGVVPAEAEVPHA
jgi:hydrophobic/amphiphilic exporter-1 (mainly G- bacteria), HAE1 family